MDIQSAVVGVSVFIVSGSILLFIYMFGMKEKSYEEAITEQRQQAKALLGSQARAKPKEKKAKKVNKKEKVKKTSDAEVLEESEDAEVTTSPADAEKISAKIHVEFKEPTVIDTNDDADTKTTNKKKRKKKEKVRSILIHKAVENPVDPDIVDVPTVNHFEQLHPKDDLELLQTHLQVKEESSPKLEKKEEKAAKPKQNGSTQDLKEKSNKVRSNNIIENKEKNKTASIAVEVAQKNKPSKPEVNQAVSEKQEQIAAVASQVIPQTNGVLQNKEKKKKKGEVNPFQLRAGLNDGEVNLLDLLNVVRNAELSRSEVQILIDLLLNKQHEAPVKLDEWSEGKSDPIQKLKKQLAEKEKALAEEQESFLAIQNKLREVRAEQNTEKSQLQQRIRSFEEALQNKQLEMQSLNNRCLNNNQKLQQMQAQLNEEGLTIRKLHEENAALQLQRKQIDMHLAQTQERDATIQDLQTLNNQLTLELRSLTEQNLASKDHHQGVLMQLQHQVNHFKTEVDDKDNHIRQLEDIRRDFEHRLSMAHRQENDLNLEVQRLNNVCQQNSEELRRLEHGKNQAYDEVKSLQKQKDELQQNISQLTSELVDVQTEKSELQLLKANGLAKDDQNHKEELLNLQNELSSIKSELQHEKIKYTAEINASKTSLNQLEQDLNEQKNKNNELRKKNWKVIEALKAAESRNNLGSPKTVHKNFDDMVAKAILEERDSNKKFIQRLFPDLKITNASSYEQWIEDMGKAIEKYVEDLEKSKLDESKHESEKLQAQVQHYKSIIDKLEGILKTLQNRIEEEEIHWQRELKAKETEIETLKQNHLSELQTKVAQIQLKLNEEVEEKQKLYDQLQSITKDIDPEDDGAQIQRNNVNKKVLVTNSESNDVCLKEQNSNATNGSSVLVQ